MAPRETSLEERTRQDAEKAEANRQRQVRLGDAPNPAKTEEAGEETAEEAPTPRARSRKK